MPSLGAWSSTTSSLLPSLEKASDVGPVPNGVSSSKIATGGAGMAAGPATWIAYWHARAPRTAYFVHEGSWFSTHASSDGSTGLGAGSALGGSVSLAVSAQGVAAGPGLGV